jgi:hypothetical protein
MLHCAAAAVLMLVVHMLLDAARNLAHSARSHTEVASSI